MYCGASLSNTECIMYALILPHSPSDITLLYKARGRRSTTSHILECIEISAMQSVLEWLASRNLFYRNITLDKGFVIGVLPYVASCLYE